jgi:tetratricopeptide (TPR) repeat protein
MLNKFEESVAAYLRALEINNKSPECHFNLASAYNDLGDFKAAAKHYLKSIEIDDSNIDAYLCLGSVYE